MTEENALITWTDKLYEPKHKSIDWFWVLGFITLVGVGLSFYFQSYIFAVVLLIAGVTIGLYANEHFEEEVFTITEKGIYADDDVYLFSDIKSFWIFEDELRGTSKLLLTLKRNFYVHVSLPLSEVDSEDVRLILRKYILEKKQNPSLADEIMELIRF